MDTSKTGMFSMNHMDMGTSVSLCFLYPLRDGLLTDPALPAIASATWQGFVGVTRGPC